MPVLTRRQSFAAAATLPFVAAALPKAALARADLQGAGQGLFQRFAVGGFEVTSLLAGVGTTDDPHSIFGLNVSDEEFAKVTTAAMLPVERARSFFTPVLVNTGAELVLFDTGLAAEGIIAALGQAGISPQTIDVVVLTHMHPDHIGGLTTEDGATPVFPKARYVTGRTEFDYWAGAENALFDRKVRPLAPMTTFLEDGGSVAGGITAIAAPGHTPGHMAYMLESNDQRLILTADTANHYLWSLGHPDWEVRYDMDKAKAAATRRSLFGMIAAEKLPFIGYHMPFPGLGYAEVEGDGFRFVPHSYQLAIYG